MDTGIHPDLRRMVGAIAIESPERYRVDGEVRRPPSFDDAESWPTGPPLVRAIARDLYERLLVAPTAAPDPRVDRLAERDLIARLSRANRSEATFQPGWRLVRDEPDGRRVVVRDSVAFFVLPENVRPLTEGAALEPGGGCRVGIPRERRFLVPGFFMAFGNADEPAERPARGVRLYWHLEATAAPAWLSGLTAGLNRVGLPFRLKAISEPRRYRRADAGLLYLDPDDVATAWPVVEKVWRRLRHRLRPATPLLTARLAPGLAVAEDGGDRASFGQDRCGRIAASVVDAYEAGEEPLARVAAAFAEAGLDPARPFLAPGSTAEYRAFAEPGRSRRRGFDEERRGGVARKGRRVRSSLVAALRLGEELCESAYWAGERCSWVGRVQGDSTAGGRRIAPKAAALEADLYRGTAGVGLFLAELAAISELDAEDRSRGSKVARTARGALHRSLDLVAKAPEAYPPLAFYSGALGIAWAAAHGAARLSDDDLAVRAEHLFNAVLKPDRSAEESLLDMISGHAGAIPILLQRWRGVGDQRCRALAIALGEEIVDAACREGGCWRWTNERVGGVFLDSPPLAGLSHGASGLGLALAELAQTTGDERFGEAARGAFSYEDRLFDGERANWPDLRDVADGQDEIDATFTWAWCHGAPGIVLARRRAAELGVATARQPALGIVLDGIERVLSQSLADTRADTSLCHGMAGLADVLAACGRRRPARQALRALVDRHLVPGDWPSGTMSRGPNPSLMLGTAGVGHALLRRVRPGSVASVLLPGGSP